MLGKNSKGNKKRNKHSKRRNKHKSRSRSKEIDRKNSKHIGVYIKEINRLNDGIEKEFTKVKSKFKRFTVDN